jgi:hypothetical protein
MYAVGLDLLHGRRWTLCLASEPPGQIRTLPSVVRAVHHRVPDPRGRKYSGPALEGVRGRHVSGACTVPPAKVETRYYHMASGP